MTTSNFDRGWRDFIKGEPWPETWDNWSFKKQRAYEEGRHVAAALKGQGLALPAKLYLGDLPGKVIALVNDEKTLRKQPAAECPAWEGPVNPSSLRVPK